MYLVKSPWLLKKIYPKLTWHIKTGKPSIFLTFDDGPIPIVTPLVLKILRGYNAKATFFCIGENVNKHPDVFAQVKADGHAIGNHTYNHLNGWKTLDEAYVANTLKTDEILHTNLFRPPYGRIKRSQVSWLKKERPNMQFIMWDVLSGDFDVNLTPEKCLANVLKHTKPGSIIVFHDSLKAFPRLEYVLPKAMEAWAKKGYHFEALIG
jgi:peptidoglycan/xylan/chitin deacetylase (PgdA/CDA1 family)